MKEDQADGDERIPFRLKSGERRGWWSNHPEPVGRAGLAMVHGAICDHRLSILLDTGASTSIMSLDLAKRLSFPLRPAKLKVKGIGGTPTSISNKTHVKITLGMSFVYYTDIWVGNIGAGMDCLLGMDFMIAAGVRLDTHNGSVKLPDEERIPRVAPGRRPRLPVWISIPVIRDVVLHPAESVCVSVIYGRRRLCDLVLWLFRGDRWVTEVVRGKMGRVTHGRVVKILTGVFPTCQDRRSIPTITTGACAGIQRWISG